MPRSLRVIYSNTSMAPFLEQGLIEWVAGSRRSRYAFPDEIGELPGELKPKLGRAVQHQRFEQLGSYRRLELMCV